MKQILKQVLGNIARPITNRVLSFKGSHKGESCYIFGDGISIKWFDLDAFPEKPAFTLSCLPFDKQANVLNISVNDDRTCQSVERCCAKSHTSSASVLACDWMDEKKLVV